MNVSNSSLVATDSPAVVYGNAVFVPLYSVWALLNVILVIWRRNKQPVKSRNPLLMLFSLVSAFMLILLLGVRYSIGRLVFPCLIFLTTFFLFAPGMFMPTLIRGWRLLFVYTSNRLKLQLSHESTYVNDRKRIKVLNVISSSLFLTALVVLLCIIHTAVMFISLGVLAGVTPNDVFFTFSTGCYMTLPILGLVVVQQVLYLIGMIILTVLLLVTRAKDAWGIRLEVITATVSFIIWSVAYFIVNVIPTYQADGGAEFYFPAGNFVYFALVIDNILTVFIPCMRSFRKNNNFSYQMPNDNSRDSRLFNILNNNETRHAFKKYGMQSFCPEAIMFWEDCQAFKHITDETAKVDHLRSIIDRFIDSSSPLELNLANKSIHAKHILDTIHRYEQYAEPIPPDCLFEIEMLVRIDLIDLFARFENTTEYSRIRKSLQTNNLQKQKTLATISMEDVLAITPANTLPV